MTIAAIANGEGKASVRGKLNAALTIINAAILYASAFGVSAASSDNTAALQLALDAAVGKELRLPAGTIITGPVTLPEGIKLVGEGKLSTILQRKASNGTNTALVLASNKNNFSIRDVALDGNKANQTAGANVLEITGCSNWQITSSTIKNAKSNAGYGQGILITDGTNDTNAVRSIINDCDIEYCDSHGVTITREFRIRVSGNRIKSNTGSGVIVTNQTFPPVANVSNFLQILDNLVEFNNGSGIEVTGFYTGGTLGAPYYGVLTDQSTQVTIANNICRSCGVWGIVYAASSGLIIGNNCNGNGTAGDAGGNFLINASYTMMTGNQSRAGKRFGVDAAGSYMISIVGNSFITEGATGDVAATYINVSGAVGGVVQDNILLFGGTAAHTGILVSGVGYIDSIPVPTLATQIDVKANKITMNGNSSAYGILVNRKAKECVVTDNSVTTTGDAMKAIMVSSKNNIVRNNRVFASAYTNLLTPAIASAGTLIVPDWAELCSITGTTGITFIQSYSQFTYFQKVNDVTITGQGSGYTPGSTVAVSFSGGGGSAAAGYAEISNEGKVIGVKITNAGSGYTSAPTITVNGAGSGATATVEVGADNLEGRFLEMSFTGALTITDGNNISLVSNFTSTANQSFLRLRGIGANWFEQSRATV